MTELLNVIRIDEECHGFIGVARDVPNAINFLCENDWLYGRTELFHDDKYLAVQDIYGAEWRKYFESCTLHELQDIFDGCFYFHIEKLW